MTTARDRYHALLRQCGYRSWKAANRRRGQLIDLGRRGRTPEQSAELAQLQELADARVELLYEPQPGLDEAMEAAIRKMKGETT